MKYLCLILASTAIGIEITSATSMSSPNPPPAIDATIGRTQSEADTTFIVPEGSNKMAEIIDAFVSSISPVYRTAAPHLTDLSSTGMHQLKINTDKIIHDFLL